jgi:hypothetical protein
MKNTGSQKNDPVVQAVLEALYRASEIDPSIVWPDNHFQELGLSPQMIDTVLMKSAASLGLQINHRGESPGTPRQMVDLLRQISQSHAS